jgi:hypothetical protein
MISPAQMTATMCEGLRALTTCSTPAAVHRLIRSWNPVSRGLIDRTTRRAEILKRESRIGSARLLLAGRARFFIAGVTTLYQENAGLMLADSKGRLGSSASGRRKFKH